MAFGQIKKKAKTLWGSLYLLISLFLVTPLLSQQTSFTPPLEGVVFISHKDLYMGLPGKRWSSQYTLYSKFFLTFFVHPNLLLLLGLLFAH